MRDQDMLTAIGADYVRSQGQICDRAIARCAGKVDQSMQPLAMKSRQSCFASNVDYDGGNTYHHAQVQTCARSTLFLGSKVLRFHTQISVL